MTELYTQAMFSLVQVGVAGVFLAVAAKRWIDRG